MAARSKTKLLLTKKSYHRFMHAALGQMESKKSQFTDFVMTGTPIVENDSDVEEDIKEEHATDSLPEELSIELIVIQRDKEN